LQRASISQLGIGKHLSEFGSDRLDFEMFCRVEVSVCDRNRLMNPASGPTKLTVWPVDAIERQRTALNSRLR
jgi:hypothetical protein